MPSRCARAGPALAAIAENDERQAVALPRAKVTGKEISIGFNWTFLAEGLRMELRRFDVTGLDQPMWHDMFIDLELCHVKERAFMSTERIGNREIGVSLA